MDKENEVNSIMESLAEKMSIDFSQHIEEFCCAFIKKTAHDPRRVVMIMHQDYKTGITIVWFEKKRGRSRKEVLQNLNTNKQNAE